ncbi:hypothetical protein MANES_08G103700v8 [Manihot esculenta]|nr:hypothetical protein MANES_08G103700v8 [Manihot esculenta]KAG8649532.1 hypothetical protein MANES_08G103700v8 [Manihot esculenta]KAG8649533.1 hypothetical protein MANES_08G103700v8 [Manihot esculenta]KAG8649534.1 hypothetical protein MANES_08G103700v8 [Manihot esculenta]KAG8649535.1 hypothetical protein MANES_08G103700v8 [Manihot esculenta]
MGACLLEKTSLNDDEESGKVLLMLGKVQFELQKLVDSYRSHIFQTITIPSESLINELQTVEDMKRQCEEKRNAYEYMIMRQREKGRGRSGKAETFSLQQLQAAHDEYDEETTLFFFRLKSLKQGQSRSLLTQAARHHAAQLCFFKKALKSLEELEPHVKLVTEQQHIDYHFTGLEDDDRDDVDGDNDEDDDTYDAPDDGELSFDRGQNDQERDVVSTEQNSMELDMMDVTFPQAATLHVAKESLDSRYEKSFSFKGENRKISQSAPLFAENKSDPAERLKQMQPSSSRRLNTYVLPTPVEPKSSNTTATGSQVHQNLKTGLSGHNLWHSSPLEQKKCEKLTGDDKFCGSTVKNAHSVLRKSNKNTASTQLPPPLAEGLLISRLDSKKIKRFSFSGPIPSKSWPTKPVNTEPPGSFSGSLFQNPTVQLPSSPKVSPKVSPTASPTFVSSPKISELHELPRPPSSSTPKSSRPLAVHSSLLAPKGHMHPRGKSLVSNSASPLPTPSHVVSRSFSIPSSSFRAMAMNISKPLETTQNSEMPQAKVSPPLTPVSLSNIQP